LGEFLSDKGIRLMVTREPGGSPGAEEIRRLLVQGETTRWDSVTEALLHFAARRDHLVRTVWPALSEGTWVLCDRFADSTLAYQGYGHGLPQQTIEALYDMTVGHFAPDLTIILDLPVEAGLERAKGRGGEEDRYERMGVEFHERLRRGFLEIAQRHPERCTVVSTTAPADEVSASIRRIVEDRLLTGHR
jgi:dTMP kinase